MKLTQRDYELLKFLWVWKLASTAVLRRRFFPNINCEIFPYKKLRQIQKAGYLNQIAFLNGGYAGKYEKLYVWALSKKGFSEIRVAMGNLKEDGYCSEYPQHDYLVSSIHLGEFLGNIPNDVRIFSENQLRRFPLHRYPAWVPKDAAHRPDGYWCIGAGHEQKIYALEVETSVKSISRYTQCASFYRRTKEIGRVFWYVESVGEAQSVQKALRSYDESRFQIHNFILLSDYVKSGWLAPIVIGGDRPQTLRDFLTVNTGNLPATTEQLVAHHAWLNPRIARVNSASSKKAQNIQNADSICIYPPKSAHAPSAVQKPSLHSAVLPQAPTQDPINEDIGV